MANKTPDDPKKEYERILAKEFRAKGQEYTARYIEAFGVESWNPSFFRGASEQAERFYKKCVDEGHPYDWYFEYPEDAEF